jgi:hypothetical protein
MYRNGWKKLGAPMKVMPLPEAKTGSWEYLLHEASLSTAI